MTFVGHERLRNKSWGSGEGGCLDGTGKAGVPSIDPVEVQLVGSRLRRQSPQPIQYLKY